MDAIFDHLGRLLDLPPVEREAAIKSLGLTEQVGTRLRGLLDHATNTSKFDEGVGAVFPTLVTPAPPEIEGFRIEREIGRGGMGVVYLAEDLKLERFVAIKVVPQTGINSSPGRALDEARTVAKLDHQGIVPVHQCGTLADSTYIISAYVEGDTLAERLTSLRKACNLKRSDSRPLIRGEAPTSRRWIDRAAGWVRDTCLAADYAHRRGVVHRDLKPSNLLLNDAESVSIADFGIATMMGRDDGLLTEQPVGSLPYMSPEQAGWTEEATDVRTDVFSLGVVLFELLTLRRPCEPGSLQNLWRYFEHQTKPVDARTLNPAVPRQLSEVCRRALIRSPGERFESAAEMARAIDEALCGEFDTGELSLAPVRRLLRRRRLTATAIAAAAATLAGAAIWFTRPPPSYGEVWFGSATPGRVTARPISPATRMPGPAIAEIRRQDRLRLDPGRYRLTVVDGGASREFTREITAGEMTAIDLAAMRAPGFRSDMVTIPGGVYIVGATDLPHRDLQPRRVTIEPFLIDRCEVSNDEYLEFVLGTSHPQPPHWLDSGEPTWGQLPVTGVSQTDARAFAEWAGKRLPTDTEWEIAAAGMNSQPYPWLDPDSSSVASEPSGLSLLQATDDARSAAVYLQGVLPVDSADFPGDTSPFGVRFMGGNVAEWTDSLLAVDPADPWMTLGIIKGNAWAAQKSIPQTNQHSMITITEIRLIGVGFRCAASIPDQG